MSAIHLPTPPNVIRTFKIKANVLIILTLIVSFESLTSTEEIEDY